MTIFVFYQSQYHTTMETRVKDIVKAMELLSPTLYAEDFDNVGLLVGNPSSIVTGILIAHDCTEAVVDEAIEKGANVIVAFHPIIFNGLKRLTGSTYVERAVMKAIRGDIAIYAIHTALDNSWEGVNEGMCRALGLKNKKILIPQKNTLYRLTTYVPESHSDDVRNALAAAGAGSIGDYDSCSWTGSGTGRFRGKEGARPYVGSIGSLHSEKEDIINVVVPAHHKSSVINALLTAHPYEEPAYEIVALENKNHRIGMGMIGSLPTPMEEREFLHFVRKTFDARGIRHSSFTGKTIKKVAVLGGSGSFAITSARRAGADAFITADLKYHDYFTANGDILLADIGHFESERFTKNILWDYISEKFTNFAVCLSDIDTNPINYLQ